MRAKEQKTTRLSVVSAVLYCPVISQNVANVVY